MNLQYRIDLLVRLGEYIRSNGEQWMDAKNRAHTANSWFTPEFIDLSCRNIANSFLNPTLLSGFASQYNLPAENPAPKTIGLVMAGNIPLVGFHDFLCVFLTGHHLVIKSSSKDDILIKHLIEKLYQWEVTIQNEISFSELLKGCDAYIATGSNNSARYFDYYFKKYPHIIRRNRTSVAVLTGEETKEELDKLSDDVHLYFGLGCRNVTKLYVPEGYDFVPLIEAFKKYTYFMEHNKYKNNYDYQLAIHLLNKHYYMSSGSLLLSENTSLFTPVSQVNYSFYENIYGLRNELVNNADVQCVVGEGFVDFGKAQSPGLTDYADGVDTIVFLRNL